MKTVGCLLIVLLGWPRLASALGPHEVVVLANRSSERSVELAREYVRLRSIPETNLVCVSVPGYAQPAGGAMTAEEFTRQVWTPACRAIAERGIADHILAWVYSVDFPVRINAGGSCLSIAGLTFLRNRLIEPEKIDKGLYLSPLYGGPNRPGEYGYSPQTLDRQRLLLGDEMPLPSMMLGYAGERGSPMPSIRRCLANGIAADGTRPTGTVWFVVSDDVRSRCREWEFEPARRELILARVAVVITNAFPAGRDGIVGLMLGTPSTDPAQARYRPGCLADNLTSFGAAFGDPNQTKLTAWIDAGATAAAGTVTEPMTFWMKFPNGRLFVHYASGCTALESYFQAIGSPLQLLVVGDPLACPWAPKDTLKLSGLGPAPPVSGVVTVKADVQSGSYYARYMWLVDGAVVKQGRGLESVDIDTRKFSSGRHVLRVVAYRAGLVASQAFAEQEFTVAATAP